MDVATTLPNSLSDDQRRQGFKCMYDGVNIQGVDWIKISKPKEGHGLKELDLHLDKLKGLYVYTNKQINVKIKNLLLRQ